MTSQHIERFLPESENNSIYEKVVEATFPILDNNQRQMLFRYMLGLIQFIATCFNFYSDRENFLKKLAQNNYKDLRWFLLYLIPFINTSIKGYDELKDLNELYTLELDENDVDKLPSEIQRIVRQDKSSFSNLDSISFRTPKYVFSNTQYSRFDKSGSCYQKVKFDYSHIDQNFKLLLGTIKQLRNKMHVNWIDIIPIRMDNYNESDLYINTITKLQSKNERLEEWDPVIDFKYDDIDNSSMISKFNEKASCMNIEDIYDTISMDLYDSIVQYKWLLFDAIIYMNGQTEIVPNIYLISAIFPNFTEMIANVDYIRTNDDIKNEFEKTFKIIIQAYPFKGSLDFLNATIVIGNGTLNSLIESIVLFFDQKYSKVTKGKTSYIPLPKELRKDNVEDYEQIKSLDAYTQQIKDTLNSIAIPAIYEFISEALNGLKNTWYGTKLLNSNKTDLNKKDITNGYKSWGDQYTEIATYKNVYNFCKSMIHRKKKNNIVLDSRDDPTTLYARFPKVWSELDDNSKEEFTKRINGEYDDHLQWFNIYWNIIRPKVLADPNYETLDPNMIKQDTKDQMKGIYNVIMNDILQIVFESMISRGTMTEMVCNLEFTNESLYDISISSDKNRLVSRIADKYFLGDSAYMKNCFYYLTNKPYSETTPFFIDDGDNNIAEYDYIKVVSNPKLQFYLSTAYNWVAQVGFIHKFINNRVNFITAATGVGKSTEVPKLYLYYLKSIDRIDNGTVVITVPRKNITENVPDYISKQLALPYEVYKDGNKIISMNYTVQFKHSGKKHIKNGNFPKIRYVTDGSVLADMKNPMLRSVRINKKKQNIYTRRDIYNVVLVDEAHEHNANMDMILSMAKNVAYYNNRFRLGIISATIEADEPSYRRYYRDVNDNRKYPLSSWIAKHNLDRINTERRFNFSPPDVGTKFPIKEIYEPGSDPVDIVKRIVSETTEGDILVFQPGVSDIEEVVKALNEDNVMPIDVIAIPYHAKITQDRQKIIKGDRSTLKISKMGNFTRDNIHVGTGNYKRLVIVATNIAEASITINTLKFVVETGLEKTARYDYRTRTVVISANYITEASRLQRKGRVGRTSAGTVYYTYQKGIMENNRKQYNISTQDSHLSIYLAFLRDMKDLPIFSPVVNQIVGGRLEETNMNASTMRRLVTESYQKISSSYDKSYVNSMIELIEELYFSNDIYYSYVGQTYAKTTFQNKTTYPYPLYFSGFDVNELTDSKGIFYIVHPDELSIDRNINGDVIRADSDVINLKPAKILESNKPKIQNMVMHSEKIKTFWSTLIDMKYCQIVGTDISKTVMGSIMMYGLSKVMDIHENTELAKMAIIAYGLTLDDQMFYTILSVLCYIAVLDIKPLTGFKADSYLEKENAKLEAKYGSKRMPSQKDILERVKDVFKPTRNHAYTDMAIMIDLVTIIDQQLKQVKNDSFKNSMKQSLMKSEYDKRESDLLKFVLGISDSTGFDDDALDRRDEIIYGLIDEYADTQIELLINSKYLRGLGINGEHFSKYIKLREKIRYKFEEMINGVDSFKRRINIEGFDSFKDIRNLMKDTRDKYISYNISPINAMLLLSLPYSIVRKIDLVDSHYVSVYSPSLDTMYSISSAHNYKHHPNTFVDSMALQQYVHYFQSDTDKASINFLTQIQPEELRLISHIYGPILEDIEIDLSNEAIDRYTKRRRDIRYVLNIKAPTVTEGDEFNSVNRVGATVEKIKNELNRVIDVRQNKLYKLTDEVLKI